MPVALTRTDGSAGRAKTDRRPVVSLNTELAAVEWNNVADVVVALSTEVGDSASPAANSIWSAVQSSRSPLDSQYCFVHDYDEPPSSLGSITVAAGGATNYVTACANRVSFGVLTLSVTNAVGSDIGVGHTLAAPFRMGQLCRFQYAVELPTLTGYTFVVGPSNTANTNYARFRWDGSALQCETVYSTGTNSATAGITIDPNKAYVFEIRWTATQTLFYVDGALVAAITSLPAAGDAFGAGTYRLSRVSGSTTELLRIDYVRVTGVRA